MTSRKHLKRLVRRRAALTGESYATALRTVRRTRQEDLVPASTPPDAAPQIVAYCSFCGKPNTEVKRLVAGPGVLICDQCVELAASIIASSTDPTPEESARRAEQYTDPSPEELLTRLPATARTWSRAEADLTRWVARLRQHGTGWGAIAEALGMEEQEAKRRFPPD